MDHIVYLDYLSKELDNLENKSKDIILRGATGRKVPYGRVFENDVLYFVNNNGEGLIRAKAIVDKVNCTDKLTQEESIKLYDSIKDRVKLHSKAEKRFKGKRYLTIITVKNFERITEFAFDKSNYSNMDDWLLVETIDQVKI